MKYHNFNTETLSSVFDTYVSSVLGYASEVWGFHRAIDVEKVHTSFCKNILGVAKSTYHDLVYYELGRLPMHVVRKLKILKYWTKIRSTNNCILKACYEQKVQDNDEWTVNIKLELDNLGLGYLWNSSLDRKIMYMLIESKFHEIHTQELLCNIQNSSKGYLYQHLVDNSGMQFYLRKPIENKYKKSISRIRMSSHKLNIESGRYNNIARVNRVCTLCNHRDVEDEFHFILKCPFYADLRTKYIKQYYFRRPSVFKLIQLLSVKNVKELNNVGKFIHFAFKRRLEA